jgi:hypothetical protein
VLYVSLSRPLRFNRPLCCRNTVKQRVPAIVFRVQRALPLPSEISSNTRVF